MLSEDFTSINIINVLNTIMLRFLNCSSIYKLDFEVNEYIRDEAKIEKKNYNPRSQVIEICNPKGHLQKGLKKKFSSVLVRYYRFV